MDDECKDIQKRRIELNISQRQLAKMAGVGRQTIVRMENRTQIPYYETRQKIRKALDMPAERRFSIEKRNEIFLELEPFIKVIIHRNRKALRAVNADFEDVYQNLSYCALRAIDRYDPTKSNASVKTFVLKNVAWNIYRSLEYFRCRGFSGKQAKNLDCHILVSIDSMLEDGFQFEG